VTRTNPLLPPGRKAPETCPHQESNRVPREMQRFVLLLRRLLDGRMLRCGR